MVMASEPHHAQFQGPSRVRESAIVKVFISYRREDTPEVVDRIANRLRQELGPEHVFKDVDNISAGENFLEKIQAALTAADVLLVVIGPGWLNASRQPGK